MRKTMSDSPVGNWPLRERTESDSRSYRVGMGTRVYRGNRYRCGLCYIRPYATPLCAAESGVTTIGNAQRVPLAGQHCGRCSKCRERRDAFRSAGVTDPTDYAVGSRQPRRD
jgi:hypothetical protein